MTEVTDIFSVQTLEATGIHIGCPTRTKYMLHLVEEITNVGITKFSIPTIVKRIDIAGAFLARFLPDEVVVFASNRTDYTAKMSEKRSRFITPLEKFGELTKCHAICGRLYPGTFTNPHATFHMEAQVLVVSDPLVDARPIHEATSCGIPVIAVCDSDAVTQNVDLIIPANNKGIKAVAATYYLLARSYLVHSGYLQPNQALPYTIEQFESEKAKREMMEAAKQDALRKEEEDRMV